MKEVLKISGNNSYILKLSSEEDEYFEVVFAYFFEVWKMRIQLSLTVLFELALTAASEYNLNKFVHTQINTKNVKWTLVWSTPA